MKLITAHNTYRFLNDISKDCTGKLGLAVARNIRILSTELTEFNDKKNELIQKYGKEVNGQVVIERGTEAFDSFMKEIKEYEDIDIDIKLTTVDEETLSNSNLTADKMAILMDFMIND